MMNTQLPILNVAGMQNLNRPASQADSFSAEVPFNQVLNKEVDNRNTETQSKPAESARDNSSEPAKTNTAADASTPPAKSDSTKTASSSDDKKDDDKADDDSDDGDDATVAASAQMLALVANVGQMAAQPVAKKDAGQDMDVLADAKGKKTAVDTHVSDKAVLHSLQSDDKGKGKSKDSGFDVSALNAGDGKEATADKDASPAKRLTTEKTLSETPADTKAAKTELQDQTAARLARTTPEASVKPAEAQQQPNAMTLAPALQQAMTLSQQAAASGQAVQRLTPAVGSQGWDQAVGQKMVWMASGGMQSASLTLNPPDLGPLQVVLHVNNQQADATFITAQPEVKHALEAAMPKLREMMDQAGIQLGQATVNTGMPNQQQGTGNHQQQARNGAGISGLNLNNDDSADINVAVVPRPAVSGGQGLVDTFA